MWITGRKPGADVAAGRMLKGRIDRRMIAARPARLHELARVDAEGRYQPAEIGFVEHAGCLGEFHPFAFALVLFLPLVGYATDLEREDEHLARHLLA